MLTSHPPLAEGLCRTGKGIEEPALGPAKGSSGQGQPAETQSSDVIGKCSNQGTGGLALYTTHPRSPAPSQQQSWVPDAAMGFRLLCVTLCLLEQVSPAHSVGASEMSLPPWDRSLVMSPAAGGFAVLWSQLPSVSFPTGLVDSGVTQTPQVPDQIKKAASDAEMFP